MNNLKILVVEDEKLLAASLKMLLSEKGYEVTLAYDGEMGLDHGSLGIYDLIILDVMMPKINGFDVAKLLRKRKIGVPILMLTAKAQIDDRIKGLNSGADYYLPKPFDNRELLACVNALLRRQGSEVDEITCGDLSLNLSTAILSCKMEKIRLSAKEFEIMRMLMSSGGANVSKESILCKVWGYDSEAVDNYVEVYIGFLRKKLTSIGSDVFISSIRKLGYHLEERHD